MTTDFSFVRSACCAHLTLVLAILSGCSRSIIAEPVTRGLLDKRANAVPNSLIPDVAGVDAGTTATVDAVGESYRWLEDLGAPRTQEWFRQLGTRSRATLDSLPLRAQFETEVRERLRESKAITSLARRPGLIFYEDRVGDTASDVLFVERGTQRTVAFDPASLASGGVRYAIDDFEPSPRGDYIAVSASRAGTEESVLYVVRTSTGKLLPERTRRRTPCGAWTARIHEVGREEQPRGAVVVEKRHLLTLNRGDADGALESPGRSDPASAAWHPWTRTRGRPVFGSHGILAEFGCCAGLLRLRAGGAHAPGAACLGRGDSCRTRRRLKGTLGTDDELAASIVEAE